MFPPIPATVEKFREDRAHQHRRIHRSRIVLNGFVLTALVVIGHSLVFAEQPIDVPDYSAVVNDLLAQGAADSRKAEQGDAGDIESRGLRPPPDFSRLFAPTVPNGAFGCFKDQGDPQGTTGRDLSGFMSTDAAMTNAKCRADCAMKGFAFAGTQVGNYCFCGNSYGRSGPSSCTTRCSGNNGEVCGGVWANSVSYTGVPVIPNPPGNGGQCVIDIKGAGQTYRHTEIQRWVVTGPSTASQQGKLYPVMWTTTGTGELHEDNGVGTKRDGSWGISGSRATQFRAQTIGGNLSIGQVDTQFNAPTGYAGWQQQTINGTPKPAGALGAQADEFVAHLPINVQGNPTQVMLPKSFTVGPGGTIPTLGFQKPASATGTVNCQWNLTLVP